MGVATYILGYKSREFFIAYNNDSAEDHLNSNTDGIGGRFYLCKNRGSKC